MTGLDEARSLLPWWVVWGPVVVRLPLVFVTSFAIAWLAIAFACWRLRYAADLPWTERAHLAYPVRMTASRISLSAAVFPALMLSLMEGRLCPLPSGLLTILAGLAGYAGGILMAVRVERWLTRRSIPRMARLRSIVLGLLIGSPLLFVAMFAPFMPRTLNMTAAILLTAAGGVLLFLGVGGGLFVARLLGLARPAPECVRNLVAKVSGAMGVPVRGVYLVSWSHANAIAFPLLRRMAFTPSILKILDEEELAAVCAHELGHLSESRLMAAARLAFLLILYPIVGVVPLVHAFGMWPVVLVMTTGLVLASRAFLWLSRYLERRADQIASDQQPESGVYARALEKISQANLTPVVEPGKGRTHPHLHDRLIAAGAQPAYPRPKPPSRRRHLLSYGLAFVLLWGFWVGLIAGLMIGSWRYGEMISLAAAAVDNGHDDTLTALAKSRWIHRRLEDGVVFRQRAATETNTSAADLPAYTALYLVSLRRCDEAETFAQEAERRLAAGGRGERSYVDYLWNAISRCRQRHQLPRRLRPLAE